MVTFKEVGDTMSYTIYDLAKDADVSVSTVSRVLNKSGPVKESTKQKILKVMKEKNYKPNVYARALNNIGLKTIGVVVSDIANPFFAEVIKGLDTIAREHEYNLVLCSTSNNPETERKELTLLLEKQIEGLIIIGSRPTDDPNREFLLKISHDFPVVLINSYIRGGDKMYSILVDEKKATYDACQHLIDRGYERIFLLGDPAWATTLKKLDALKDCLSDNHLPYEDEQFIGTYYSYTAGKPAVNELISKYNKERFAIFCCSDMIALGALRELKAMNISVPSQVAVVGYSNTPVSGLTSPSLTTVDQRMNELGEKGMLLFIDILKGKKPKHRKTYCDYELVIRETT